LAIGLRRLAGQRQPIGGPEGREVAPNLHRRRRPGDRRRQANQADEENLGNSNRPIRRQPGGAQGKAEPHGNAASG